MSFNDFWINNNGKTEQLNNAKHGVRKEQMDKKFHNLFDAYDANSDGTLETEEIEGLFTGLTKFSGGDKTLDVTENKQVASLFANQVGIKDADFMGFVKSVSDASEEIVSSTTSKGVDGGNVITTTYKNGLIEIIHYYPDGEFKLKTQKQDSVTESTTYIYTNDGKNYKQCSQAELDKMVKDGYKKQRAAEQRSDSTRITFEDGYRTNFMKVHDVLPQTNRNEIHIDNTDMSDRAKAEAEIRDFVISHYVQTHKDCQNALDTMGILDDIGAAINVGAGELWNNCKNIYNKHFGDGTESDYKNFYELVKKFEPNYGKALVAESSLEEMRIHPVGYFTGETANINTEKGLQFQQTTEQYQNATILKTRIDILKDAMREISMYESEQNALTYAPAQSEGMNPASHILNANNLLLQYFDGDEKAVNMILNGTSGNAQSTINAIKGIAEATQKMYDSVTNGKSFDEIKNDYQSQYKDIYGTDFVPDDLTEKVMDAKATGGMVKLAAITAISVLITKSPIMANISAAAGGAEVTGAAANMIRTLASRYGATVVQQGVNFAVTSGTLATDVGLTLLNQITSKRGVDGEELWENTKSSAKYIYFGAYIGAPLAQAVSKQLGKIGVTAKMFEGGIKSASGAIQTTSITGKELVQNLMKGGNKVLTTGGAFLTDVAAFSALEVATEDMDPLTAGKEQTEMLGKLKIMNHFIEYMLGGKVHAGMSKAKMDAAIERSGVKNWQIKEIKSPNKTIYEVEVGEGFPPVKFKDKNQLATAILERVTGKYADNATDHDVIETTSTPDGAKTTTVKRFDDNGNVIGHEETTSKPDETKTATTKQYDKNGTICAQEEIITSPDGKLIGRTETERTSNPDGTETTTVKQYDKNGTICAQEEITTSPDGKLIDRTETERTSNPDGTETTTVKHFNRTGNVTAQEVTETIIKPDGTKTTTVKQFNENGNVTSHEETETIIKPDGTKTTTVKHFSESGNVIGQEVTETIIKPDGTETTTVKKFNKFGDVTSHTETTLKPDGEKIIISEKRIELRRVELGYNLTETTYGREVTETTLKPDGTKTTIKKYDENGNVTLQEVTETALSPDGKLIGHTETEITTNADATKTTTTKKYDKKGILYAQEEITTSPDGKLIGRTETTLRTIGRYKNDKPKCQVVRTTSSDGTKTLALCLEKNDKKIQITRTTSPDGTKTTTFSMFNEDGKLTYQIKTEIITDFLGRTVRKMVTESGGRVTTHCYEYPLGIGIVSKKETVIYFNGREVESHYVFGIKINETEINPGNKKIFTLSEDKPSDYYPTPDATTVKFTKGDGSQCEVKTADDVRSYLKSFKRAQLNEEQIEQLVKLFNAHPKRFNRIANSGFFDLVDCGYINESKLENLFKIAGINENTTFSNRTLAEIKMVKEQLDAGIVRPSLVKEVPKDVAASSWVNENVRPGEVYEHNGKLYVREGDSTFTELKLTKEKFDELFPPLSSTFNQGRKLGDCWLVSSIDNLMDYPQGRASIFKMFEQRGNDISVQFTTSSEPYIFPNGDVRHNGDAQVQGAVGVQMLEMAYARHRFSHVDLPEQMADYANTNSFIQQLTGGREIEAFENIVGNDGQSFSGFNINALIMKYIIGLKSNNVKGSKIRTIIENNTNSVDNIISIDFHKDLPLPEYYLYGSHEYALKSFDPNTQMCYLTNPWNTATLIEVPLDVIMEHVKSLDIMSFK